MANEISVNFNLTVNKGNVNDVIQASFQDDVAADPALVQQRPIGVTNTAANLTLGDLTTPRWAKIQNAGDTNDLVVGIDATGFQEVLRIPPGKANLLRIGNSVTLQLKTDSSTTTAVVEAVDA